MPKLEAEESIAIGDGASFPRTKKKRAAKQEQVLAVPGAKRKRAAPTKATSTSKKPTMKQEQDASDSGNKRKRKAASDSTSTSKKVKQEAPSIDPELEQEGPFSSTRSKARAKAKVGNAVAVSEATAAFKTASGQQDDEDDDDDDDEVKFISSRPVRRVVARIEID